MSEGLTEKEQKLHDNRASIYGLVGENAEDCATIMKIFFRADKLEGRDLFFIFNIIQKLIRIANSPYYKDSHDDLRLYDALWWEDIEARNGHTSDS